MRREGRTYIVALAACLVVVGCSKKEEAPSAPPPEPVKAEEPAVEAQEIFQSRCVTCHGETGKGDGPGSAALNPKPRDYTSADWQKSVTDDHIKKIIVEGGPAVGLSALMPPNPDLKDKPEVVDELVKVVRGLGQAQ
jgi:mono/diheme cytochrome c family protein